MEDLYIPFVRCPTCNKVIGHLHSKYLQMLKEGISPEDALNQLGLNRYCCRVRTIEAPMVQEGFLVEDKIKQIQERTGKLHIETGKRYNVRAVNTAMSNQADIEVKQSQQAKPKMVRLVPTTIGKIRVVKKQ